MDVSLLKELRGSVLKKNGEGLTGRSTSSKKILADSGVIILKFWLHIDRETQLERFKSRLNDPEKRWKITEDDWRNRNRWEDYKIAADEMLQKTSTLGAPWIIIESRDKRYSRVKVLKTTAETLEKELES